MQGSFHIPQPSTLSLRLSSALCACVDPLTARCCESASTFDPRQSHYSTRSPLLRFVHWNQRSLHQLTFFTDCISRAKPAFRPDRTDNRHRHPSHSFARPTTTALDSNDGRLITRSRSIAQAHLAGPLEVHRIADIVIVASLERTRTDNHPSRSWHSDSKRNQNQLQSINRRNSNLK